jgi:hypothetical protein
MGLLPLILPPRFVEHRFKSPVGGRATSGENTEFIGSSVLSVSSEVLLVDNIRTGITTV